MENAENVDRSMMKGRDLRGYVGGLGPFSFWCVGGGELLTL
jgi:hypothetical protein